MNYCDIEQRYYILFMVKASTLIRDKLSNFVFSIVTMSLKNCQDWDIDSAKPAWWDVLVWFNYFSGCVLSCLKRSLVSIATVTIFLFPKVYNEGKLVIVVFSLANGDVIELSGSCISNVNHFVPRLWNWNENYNLFNKWTNLKQCCFCKLRHLDVPGLCTCWELLLILYTERLQMK